MSAPDLRLVLPATAENVGVVRHALAGLAEALGMDAGRIGDLKTVVTEACMNAVVHAYPEEAPGPLEVDASRDEHGLVVRVCDHGGGIRPRAEAERQSLRMGLPLIAALSDTFGISGGPGQGTVVTMCIGLSTNGSEPRLEAAPPAPPGAAMAMPAGGLIAPVLSRVISLFAVRADFSVDRLSDAILLGDAVAAEAGGHYQEGTAQMLVNAEGTTVTVRLGPLLAGAGERLLESLRIPDLDASLERLADEVRVEHQDDGEYLLIDISARRG